MKTVALGALGGAAAAGGAFGLDHLNLSNLMKAGILAGGGAIGGIAACTLSPGFGAGLAGGGVAFGAKAALDHFVVAGATEQTEAIPGYAYRKFGRTPHRRRHMSAGPAPYGGRTLHGAQVDMSAVQADLGAVEADLGAAQVALT